MRKRLQRRIHVPQKSPEIAQQVRRMRAHFGEDSSVQKGEKPDESRRAICSSNRSEQFTAAIRRDARQGQLRCALRQMRQRPALQIDKRMLPGRMHDFEDEGPSVCADQMEIVVVFARQGSRAGFQPIDFPRQANGFRFCRWLSYARFEQHAPNLIRKCRTASIPELSNHFAQLACEGRMLSPRVFLAIPVPKPAHSQWKA